MKYVIMSKFLLTIIFVFIFSCEKYEIIRFDIKPICDSLYHTYSNKDSVLDILGQPNEILIHQIKNNNELEIYLYGGIQITYNKNIHSSKLKLVSITISDLTQFKNHKNVNKLRPNHIIRFMGKPTYFVKDRSGKTTYMYNSLSCNKFEYISFYFKYDQLEKLTFETLKTTNSK